MGKDIQSLREEAHFIQGEVNPNFENIFRTLQEEEYLDKNMDIQEWQEHIEGILESLIDLKDFKTDIVVRYVGSFVHQDLPVKIDTLIPKEQGGIVSGIVSLISNKQELLRDAIGADLQKNLLFSSPYPIEFSFLSYDSVSELIDCDDSGLKKVDDFFGSYFDKGLVLLEIKIQTKVLINSLIGKFSILKGLNKVKMDFIQKFKNRKVKKEQEARKFFWLGIFTFLCVIAINGAMFYWNFDKSIELSEFWGNFLGKNIYLFSVELILVLLAFYFLWLFKVHKKIIELYDSHILLIESDDYYKNDLHFRDSGVDGILAMRIANAQKIHDLPKNIFDVFNGKDSFASDLPVGKLLDTINELAKNVNK